MRKKMKKRYFYNVWRKNIFQLKKLQKVEKMKKNE